MKLSQTASVIVAALGLGAAAFAPGPQAASTVPDDVSLGDPNAKVVLIEYVSPTCPHCALWDAETFEALKAKYVDTGKVRFVLREAPIHEAVDYAGFMVARCAGQDQYLKVLRREFALQPEMGVQLENIRDVFIRAGGESGLSEAQFTACLSDEASADRMKARTDREMREFDVQGVPTFVLNGKVIAETQPDGSLENLSAHIDPLLAETRP